MPGIPADPGRNNGENATGADLNDKVHIHRGVLGDTKKYEGFSDLDRRIHRWLNLVAREVVNVE